ncbi:hypothetical protein FSST1_009883 [Fusarium sambucinum]
MSSQNEALCPVHIYIDDSNLVKGGKKEHNSVCLWSRNFWIYDVNELHRIIMQKLNRRGTVNFESPHLHFYGSFLHRNPQIENLDQENRSNVTVFRCSRNSMGQEKQVDTKLCVDMVVKAMATVASQGKCVFVLVSGDSDMIPAVKQAVECGFHVHVWSWSKRLSSEFRILARQERRVKIFELDLYLYRLKQ